MYYNMSNHFIIDHKDHQSINGFNSNLKSSDINPLLRKSMKKILNIDTRFRNNYSTTESTSFGINLPEQIKKVVSLKLVNFEAPSTIYNVSEKLGSNTFKANGTSYNIPSGYYTDNTLVTAINKCGMTDISLNYIPDTKKMEFSL